MVNYDELYRRLYEALPVTFPRARVHELTGGLVAGGTVANAMSRGTGPQGAYCHGRKVMLCRDEFLDWLLPRLTFLDNSKQ